jgi:hypothetical protein
MIDFRYHLVSIVAVFLALAIGIVLGSTELQGNTIDGLRSLNNSLTNQLNAVRADRDGYATQANASATFLQTAEPKLLAGMLTGTRIVMVTEPGASSGVIGGIEKAAGYAGATITGTVALQPKFNDLSGASQSSLSTINAQLAAANGTPLTPASSQQTGYQQNAAQLIATAVLNRTAGESGLTVPAAQTILGAYGQAGYLTVSGAPWNRATLAVLVTPATAPADGAGDPANQVLLAVTQEFAAGSAATIVAGSVAASATAAGAIPVLRGSGLASRVSSVDNADVTLGQVSVIWALSDQLAGAKPGSYGIAGASAVSPVPLPVPSVTPTAPSTPTPTPTHTHTHTTAKKK